MNLPVLDPAVAHYAVLGNPVEHSRSPEIHAAFARAVGVALQYHRVRVEPGTFAATLSGLRSRGLRGCNVTLPCKADAWRSATVRTPRAERCGSVNTIWFGADGGCFGDTTDGIGLVRDLRTHGVDIAGRDLLLLGAGGAAAGVLADLLAERPRSVLVANRTADKASALAAMNADAGPVAAAPFAQLSGMRFDLVVNATSAGLAGQLPSLPPGLLLNPGACCYDMLYGAATRPFRDWAVAQCAALVLDGIGMLVEQAAESFFIWEGVRPDTAAVIAMVRSAATAG